MDQSGYEGRYRIKRTPRSMAPHNKATWQRFEKLLEPKGSAYFDELVAAARDHQHGTKTARHPYQFVTYCIRQGWLERTGD